MHCCLANTVPKQFYPKQQANYSVVPINMNPALTLVCCALLGVAAASYIPHGHQSHDNAHGLSYSIQAHHEAPAHKSWHHEQPQQHWAAAPQQHWAPAPHQHWATVPQHVEHQQHHDEHHHHHPKYEFSYGVKDTKTGDIKQQWETRDGDKVKGGYTMKEADGRTRVVEYTADAHNGFQATVKHIGHADHQTVHKSYHQGHHGHGHEQASSYVDVKQGTDSKWW
ncbi:histidine-rich glycoprotein [Drosophila busckii]|uniref:histidine-rich glycoprotein n=1 Tax=Drosophila busckii TaxID=30019 RepID=UPI00143304FE|nr:histidine-rich glycoprotein [Drosophila busckii]